MPYAIDHDPTLETFGPFAGSFAGLTGYGQWADLIGAGIAATAGITSLLVQQRMASDAAKRAKHERARELQREQELQARQDAMLREAAAAAAAGAGGVQGPVGGAFTPSTTPAIMSAFAPRGGGGVSPVLMVGGLGVAALIGVMLFRKR
ncbi:MAG TPA: hypothetical protein VFH61_06735 [Thermoleophilia bacterium]|nr:hypothetical protein [Thermoleophilia bacterium]